MKRKFLILISLFFSIHLFSGSLKVLEPELGPPLVFTPEYIKNFNSPDALKRCGKLMDQIIRDGRTYKSATRKEREVLRYCEETKDNPWMVQGIESSWSMVAKLKKISASSSLISKSNYSYGPGNAYDNNYKTAWVEGAADYGIGEYLEFSFPSETPRITKIIVVNGYVKSKAAWEANSRVKKLKLYINNEPYAILNLKDERAEQSFNVAPLGNSNRDNSKKLRSGPAWTLKFEILEVYKGTKYGDTAISEIYFDGIDVF